MKKNNNKKKQQYFIYGLVVPVDWYKEWEKVTGKDFFIDFSSFINEEANRDKILCVFKGRDGEFLIIGKVISKINDEDINIIPEITNTQKHLVESKVKDYFNLEGEYNYYFIKN